MKRKKEIVMKESPKREIDRQTDRQMDKEGERERTNKKEVTETEREKECN